MKIRSLLLGSVAAAGLSTGAFAADLGVLTSLDVCDALGLSGLTISSDTNCLQISGGVEYEYIWGDYAPAVTLATTGAGVFTIAQDGFDAVQGPAANLDWSSKVKAWVKFVGTADSDFGPAKAVIKLLHKQYTIVTNEQAATSGSATTAFVIDEAYVSVGDSTVIMAGKKGSIMNVGTDEPLNFLGLFNSEKVDKGVKWSGANAFNSFGIPDGGHVIQIVSDLGNGVSVGAGLENLNGTLIAAAGTAVGVIAYAGDGIAAHLTVAGAGFADGVVENWGFHAGFAGTFDVVKVVAAIAGDNSGYWNALGSASATFDIFTLAISGEAVQNNTSTGGGNGGLDTGFGGSISAAVTDGVTINLGGRWYRDAGAAIDSYQVAAQLVAAVTETITLTGEVGLYANNAVVPQSVYYGAGTLAWAPGGGFTSSIKGEAYSNGAYKATFKAAKTFE
jgi:hypothetical protein